MDILPCQFNDSYFPIMDGVGMTAHNYARWLQVRYGKSFLVAPKVKDYKDTVDYKVLRFKSVLLPGMNPYRVGLPLVDFKFKKKLSKHHFDILHAHCPFISGQLALKMARKMDIPLIATFHTKYKEDYKKAISNELIIDFMMNLTLDFYNKADYVWVPNKATGETLKQYGYTGEFTIMPNGTDMEIPEKSKYLKLRRKGLDLTGSKDDDFIMLFVGQHRWEKNVRTILDALRILKSNNEPFKMIFAGEGYAMSDMKKIVKKYGLNDSVEFMGVVTSRQTMSFLYACADLFVFPSVYDNAPLVIREAAAFDVPSIVVKNSSASEGMLEDVNGFFINNTPESLAGKIMDLKKNPEAIHKTGEVARKSLYLSWESVVDDVAVKYQEIVKEHENKMSLKSKKLENSSDIPG